MKADGGTLVGRHDDSIVGLGFQGVPAFTVRRKTPEVDSGDDPGVRTTTKEHELVSEKPAIDDTDTEGMCLATMSSQHQGNALISDPGHGKTSACGGREKEASEVDRKEGQEEDRERGEEDKGEENVTEKEEEVGFGLVVLSASMDGVIRAWEMLGKSEKYRMRHTAGVEVTSMLVLPGGSVVVTGQKLVQLQICSSL